MDAPKKDCCHGECDELMQERIHYFTGRHLAARDFSDEQLYHRTHRYLHNRMLHGWGVVCGLEVVQHDQEDCRTKFVRVGAGLALDCCGREIVVQRPACCADEQPEIPWDKYDPSRPWLLLCLSYDECGKEQVPVIDDKGDCSTEKTATRFGRYKESWKLDWHWVSKKELHKKYGWGAIRHKCPQQEEPDPDPKQEPKQDPKQGTQNQPQQAQMRVPAPAPDPKQPSVPDDTHDQPHSKHPHVHALDCHTDDCIDPCDDGYVSCVETKCPPGHCVPLAIICVNQGEPITKDNIEMFGRPKLPYRPQRLTHVVDINWPHGGLLTHKQLKKLGSLTVTFDRKLRQTPSRSYPGPWGVNQATFVVQVGRQTEDLDFLPYQEAPRLLDNLLQAEYKFRSDYETLSDLMGKIVWITIKGDFLFDCHGARVDGNNNGVEGGTFESWFQVVGAEEYEELQEEAQK